MTLYAPQSPTVAGATPTYNAASASDTYTLQPATKYLLHIKTTGTVTNVTVTDVASVSPVGAQAFTPSPLIAMPATGERMILIDSNRFRDPNTGVCTIAFSSITGVTHAMWAQQ